MFAPAVFLGFLFLASITCIFATHSFFCLMTLLSKHIRQRHADAKSEFDVIASYSKAYSQPDNLVSAMQI